MKAEEKLSPWQVITGQFEYGWAPAFPPSAFHRAPPLLAPHPHTPGAQAQGANLAAELSLRTESGQRLSRARPVFRQYLETQRLRFDAPLTFEWGGAVLRRRGDAYDRDFRELARRTRGRSERVGSRKDRRSMDRPPSWGLDEHRRGRGSGEEAHAETWMSSTTTALRTDGAKRSPTRSPTS